MESSNEWLNRHRGGPETMDENIDLFKIGDEISFKIEDPEEFAASVGIAYLDELRNRGWNNPEDEEKILALSKYFYGETYCVDAFIPAEEGEVNLLYMHRINGLTMEELLEIPEVKEIEDWSIKTYNEGILWAMCRARLKRVDAQDFEKNT